MRKVAGDRQVSYVAGHIELSHDRQLASGIIFFRNVGNDLLEQVLFGQGWWCTASERSPQSGVASGGSSTLFWTAIYTRVIRTWTTTAIHGFWGPPLDGEYLRC